MTAANRRRLRLRAEDGRTMKQTICSGMGAEPVAWWIPAAELFCIKKPGERPFARAWQPLYATAPVHEGLTAWKDVRVDGLPPCDGQTVYVGENSAGYMGCFTMADEHGCWMETPEDDSMIMGDLRYWRVQDRPTAALEAGKEASA